MTGKARPRYGGLGGAVKRIAMSSYKRSTPHPNNFPEYVPTPEEIAATCTEIQATWDEKTRHKRLVTKPHPLVLPKASVSQRQNGQLLIPRQ